MFGFVDVNVWGLLHVFFIGARCLPSPSLLPFTHEHVTPSYTQTPTHTTQAQAQAQAAADNAADDEEEEDETTVVVDPVFPRAGSQRTTATAPAPVVGMEMGASGVTSVLGGSSVLGGGGAGVDSGVGVGMGDSQR